MRRATRPSRRKNSHLQISIHALHEESDTWRSNGKGPPYLFQSTLSMRRATEHGEEIRGVAHISIHALHEESDIPLKDTERYTLISIHALHEESDPCGRQASFTQVFQSTLSMRRATSICAPLRDVLLFQSTLSMRRATDAYVLNPLDF